MPETRVGTDFTYTVSKKGVLRNIVASNNEGTEIMVNAVFSHGYSGQNTYNTLMSYNYTSKLAPGSTSHVPIARHDVEKTDGAMRGTAYVKMIFYSSKSLVSSRCPIRVESRY